MEDLLIDTVVEGDGEAPHKDCFCVIGYTLLPRSIGLFQSQKEQPNAEFSTSVLTVSFLLEAPSDIPPLLHRVVKTMKPGGVCKIELDASDSDIRKFITKTMKEAEVKEDIWELFLGGTVLCEFQLIRWEVLQDVSPENDGTILMIAADEYDTWEKPIELCKIKLNYIMKLESGEILEDTRQNGAPLKFTVDEGEVIEGIDFAVRLLTRASAAYLVLKGKYAFDDLLSYPQRLPQRLDCINKTIHFDKFKIESMKNPRNPSELNLEEKIARAHKMVENGNMWFMKKCPQKSLHRYKMGISAIEYLGGKSTADDELKVRPLLFQLFLNSSQCHILLKNSSEALRLAEEVLKFEPENKKALYRKISALKELEEYNTAEIVARHAIDLYPRLKQFRGLLKSILDASTGDESLQVLYKKIWHSHKK